MTMTLEQSNRAFRIQQELEPEDQLLFSQALRDEANGLGNFAINSLGKDPEGPYFEALDFLLCEVPLYQTE